MGEGLRGCACLGNVGLVRWLRLVLLIRLRRGLRCRLRRHILLLDLALLSLLLLLLLLWAPIGTVAVVCV